MNLIEYLWIEWAQPYFLFFIVILAFLKGKMWCVLTFTDDSGGEGDGEKPILKSLGRNILIEAH